MTTSTAASAIAIWSRSAVPVPTTNYVSPDFYRLVPWDGEGFMPMGYGYDSVAANLENMQKIESAVQCKESAESLNIRRKMIQETDDRGIIATPANSSINELVVEAARLSILHDGDWAQIVYGDKPHVQLRAKN